MSHGYRRARCRRWQSGREDTHDDLSYARHFIWVSCHCLRKAGAEDLWCMQCMLHPVSNCKLQGHDGYASHYRPRRSTSLLNIYTVCMNFGRYVGRDNNNNALGRRLSKSVWSRRENVFGKTFRFKVLVNASLKKKNEITWTRSHPCPSAIPNNGLLYQS